MHLSPADTVIHEFGGVRATARALGMSPGAVSKWRIPREQRGTGGLIPSQMQQKILEVARTLGLYLTAQELVLGRDYD